MFVQDSEQVGFPVGGAFDKKPRGAVETPTDHRSYKVRRSLRRQIVHVHSFLEYEENNELLETSFHFGHNSMLRSG